jgi:Aminoglycoside-2''-adenylyltransferase
MSLDGGSYAPAVVASQNEVQLKLIDELGRLLGEANIRFWLRGGWALDFHLGRLTRQHADIDLVTWLCHRERLTHLLTSRGFSEVAGYPKPQLVIEKCAEEASFLFIGRHGGHIVVPAYEAWPFRPGAFPAAPRTLDGVSARIVSPEQLLYEKLHHEEWSGKPLRPKDHDSIALLRALTASLSRP